MQQCKLSLTYDIICAHNLESRNKAKKVTGSTTTKATSIVIPELKDFSK